MQPSRFCFCLLSACRQHLVIIITRETSSSKKNFAIFQYKPTFCIHNKTCAWKDKGPRRNKGRALGARRLHLMDPLTVFDCRKFKGPIAFRSRYCDVMITML